MMFFIVVFILLKTAINPNQEAIIFFPIHKDAQFLDAETEINITKQNKINYKIEYNIYSNLDRNAYLRQDIGLLFKNGKLILPIGIKTWKQNTSILRQSESKNENGSGYYDAVSFHYGEIQEKSKINSIQIMSADQLYVIQSKFDSQYISFHKPRTEKEKEWEHILKQVYEKQINTLWKNELTKLGVNINEYTSIPLTSLPKYNDQPLPGFTKKQSQEIIGKLWEGLYKNYLLGIKKEDGTSVESLGSTVPLILINQNKKELIVLILTKNLEPILLKQLIS